MEIKYADCEPLYTYQAAPKVKNVWSCTFTPPELFKANLSFTWK